MKIISTTNLILSASLIFVRQAMAADSILFQSSPEAAQLLELYTSEGCSSCPLAEKWFSQLKHSPKLWTEMVPIAFHVDYWDNLGWKDVLASKVYTQRQYQYSDSWQRPSVATPGFIVDGKNWQGWFRQDPVPPPTKRTIGVLSAASQDAIQWQLRFAPVPQQNQTGYVLHVALLGFGIKTNVRAGENSGRVLDHDFVTLAFAEGPAEKSGDVWQRSFKLASITGVFPQRTGLAAWATVAGAMTPLQAVGGWIPKAIPKP